MTGNRVADVLLGWLILAALLAPIVGYMLRDRRRATTVSSALSGVSAGDDHRPHGRSCPPPPAARPAPTFSTTSNSRPRRDRSATSLTPGPGRKSHRAPTARRADACAASAGLAGHPYHH